MGTSRIVITCAQRRELEADLHSIRAGVQNASDASRESRNVVELDQQSVGRLSRMDALQNQAMAQADEQRRKQQAARAITALARIEDGSFGICEECDEPIAFKRLKLDPTLSTCIICASGG